MQLLLDAQQPLPVHGRHHSPPAQDPVQTGDSPPQERGRPGRLACALQGFHGRADLQYAAEGGEQGRLRPLPDHSLHTMKEERLRGQMREDGDRSR
jgi:hypothetical protein